MSTQEQEYQRWYIVPAEEFTPGDTDAARDIRPKYSDLSAIDSYSAAQVTPTTVGENYAALVQTYASVDPWYIVQYLGTGTDGWQALNQVSIKADTRNLATNPEDVEAVLNQRLPGVSRTAAEWGRSFFARGKR